MTPEDRDMDERLEPSRAADGATRPMERHDPAPQPKAEHVTTTPRVLGGRYEVGELIGRGGMADVHLGHDTRLGRQVAIKMLRSDLARDANFLMRFRREAQSAAGLNHPAIVAIFDSGEDDSTVEGPGVGTEPRVPQNVTRILDAIVSCDASRPRPRVGRPVLCQSCATCRARRSRPERGRCRSRTRG